MFARPCQGCEGWGKRGWLRRADCGLCNGIGLTEKRHIQCLACRGTGTRGFFRHMCKLCKGPGHVADDRELHMCPQCRATGKIGLECFECGLCGGACYTDVKYEHCIKCGGKGRSFFLSPCTACRGSSFVEGPQHFCPRCNTTGRCTTARGKMQCLLCQSGRGVLTQTPYPCDQCKGRGVRPKWAEEGAGADCRSCAGQGYRLMRLPGAIASNAEDSNKRGRADENENDSPNEVDGHSEADDSRYRPVARTGDDTSQTTATASEADVRSVGERLPEEEPGDDHGEAGAEIESWANKEEDSTVALPAQGFEIDVENVFEDGEEMYGGAYQAEEPVAMLSVS